MIIKIDGKDYHIEIIYKNNKNMYLRIKNDLSIVVTAPRLVSKNRIASFVDDNMDYITSVVRKKRAVLDRKKDKFQYLGNLYDICYTNKRGVEIIGTHAFISHNVNIDNFYKKEAAIIFPEMYDRCFDNFKVFRKKPQLKIRKMTSKWGVCNVTDNIITLNLELIKLNPRCLEYVIYHELCHLKHPDHSRAFWREVEKYVPDYKKIKKEMENT